MSVTAHKPDDESFRTGPELRGEQLPRLGAHVWLDARA